MNKKRNFKTLLILGLAGMCLSAEAAAVTGLQVSFKSDPRVTSGVPEGVVLPPARFGAIAPDAMQALLQNIDKPGDQVRITGKRAGETVLEAGRKPHHHFRNLHNQKKNQQRKKG